MGPTWVVAANILVTSSSLITILREREREVAREREESGRKKIKHEISKKEDKGGWENLITPKSKFEKRITMQNIWSLLKPYL